MITRVAYFVLCSLVFLGAMQAQQKLLSRYNRLTGQTVAYPEVSIQYIQEVAQDSLLLANSLQNTVPARWTLQTSDHNLDTVVVTAICVVPGKVITFTNRGYTMLLADTADKSTFRHILCRATSDTASHILDGFLNVERGDVIKMTGVISEFPTTSMNSATQFAPIPGIAVEIVGSQEIPPPISRTAGTFYNGIFPGGQVNYSGGEPYEGMIVQLTNLVVDARVNTSRGTFSMVDGSGNQIAMYDGSRYFTLKGTSVDHPFADPTWTTQYPVAGTVIDTIRGFIHVVSGSESPRGYRICPIYYGDIVFGVVRPAITTHRRNPIIVPSDSAALVSCRVRQLSGGQTISAVTLVYQLDETTPVELAMTYNATDSTYGATIPAQAEGTMVNYFIKATDVSDNTSYLASSAFGGASSDTSQGRFFYTVKNTALTVHDIQYTPYRNGRTPYLGAVTTVSGIVTADTASIHFTALTTGGTSALYMQSGNAPWSGIWIVGPESVMVSLHNGDSVTVTGSVAENFDVTRIENISSAVVHSNANPLPEPVALTTGAFSAGLGDPRIEPYEGMLVRLTDVAVVDLAPTFADATEYAVNDGSGPALVRRDGTNSYSNVAADTVAGKSILHLDDRINALTGIVYYSFTSYKIVPRTDADYTVLRHPIEGGWNLVSLPVDASDRNVGHLFPGAISRCYRFTYKYEAETVLTPGEGYWIRFPSNGTASYFGTPRVADTIDVSSGWNLVGSIGSGIPSASIASEPPGMITSSFFAYTGGGYVVVDSIVPGAAYWVKTASSGTLRMSAAPGAPAAAAITIVPDGELPPPPPSENHPPLGLVPTIFALEQNFPNPFNPVTQIRYSLETEGFVTLKVYDLLGQEVATLVQGLSTSGEHAVTWNAGNAPSGVYVARLEGRNGNRTMKMLLLR
jgi:hypothetical protein